MKPTRLLSILRQILAAVAALGLVACDNGELAAPETVPPELRGLRLTKVQAEKVEAWRKSHIAPGTTAPDPAKYAQFLESVLHSDQQPEFRKLVTSGGGK